MARRSGAGRKRRRVEAFVLKPKVGVASLVGLGGPKVMVVFGGAVSSPKLQVLACEVRTVTSRPLAVADRPATQGSGVALVPASQSATSAPFRKTSTLVSSAAGGSSESSRRNCSTRNG